MRDGGRIRRDSAEVYDEHRDDGARVERRRLRRLVDVLHQPLEDVHLEGRGEAREGTGRWERAARDGVREGQALREGERERGSGGSGEVRRPLETVRTSQWTEMSISSKRRSSARYGAK